MGIVYPSFPPTALLSLLRYPDMLLFPNCPWLPVAAASVAAPAVTTVCGCFFWVWIGFTHIVIAVSRNDILNFQFNNLSIDPFGHDLQPFHVLQSVIVRTVLLIVFARDNDVSRPGIPIVAEVGEIEQHVLELRGRVLDVKASLVSVNEAQGPREVCAKAQAETVVGILRADVHLESVAGTCRLSPSQDSTLGKYPPRSMI